MSQGSLCSVGSAERKKVREIKAGSRNNTDRSIAHMELLKPLSGMWIFLLIPQMVLRMLQQRCDIIVQKQPFGILYGENRTRWRLGGW